jgi:hypothetical protein
VFITAGPSTKLFTWGGGGYMGGHRVAVCPLWLVQEKAFLGIFCFYLAPKEDGGAVWTRGASSGKG